MKKIFQRTGLALIVASAVTVAHAANNANFDINAEIPSSVDVASTQNMSFGQLNPGSQGGVATIATDGTLSFSPGSDITSIGGTVQAATITLDSTSLVTVSLQTPKVTLTNADGQTMEVDNFTYEGGAGTDSNEIDVQANVTKTLNVGAAMVVAGGQAAGTYSGIATVTATIK